MTPRVLVTGANGFVGAELCAHLGRQGYRVVSVVRRATAAGGAAVGEIDDSTSWEGVLKDVDVVIHLAARVHVMDGKSTEADFERINVCGSAHLARAAAIAGVKRLVFVSSIKVNGEATHGKPFDENDVPRPEDAYGRSKLAAELALQQISADTGLELVIVRPPMVVGPGTKGNLPALLRALSQGRSLPLASVRNRRSFVGVRSLVCLLELCAIKVAAAGEIFLVADEPALSTPELIAGLARGLGSRARLWPVPVPLLRALARLSGKHAQIDRLSGDLEVDAGKARNLLGWASVESLDDVLFRTAQHYLSASEPDA
ncbi:NAD-dependent epimerase/dehydratase family protein [Uliginosibacterium sp. H3]|uniref:NAD-dependent epimerase/dehydratase family protein n=1 Tax=Uliginosibacterium silvisoli TaxID=3114758 RepID=A0ABU6K1P9_9RHOO|nr:NAD-dependent epimerase/dehydratase family protein [Uliginosibacterium sp. H3]